MRGARRAVAPGNHGEEETVFQCQMIQGGQGGRGLRSHQWIGQWDQEEGMSKKRDLERERLWMGETQAVSDSSLESGHEQLEFGVGWVKGSEKGIQFGQRGGEMLCPSG